MFFEIRKDDFNGLTASPIHPLGFCRLHPCAVRHDQVFVCAAPQAPTAFLARGALRP